MGTAPDNPSCQSRFRIVVTRLTTWVQREAQRTQQWVELDATYARDEFHLSLHGWSVQRRFVVIRERIRDSRAGVGRKLIDVAGYAFRIYVASRRDAPEEYGATTIAAPTWRTASRN